VEGLAPVIVRLFEVFEMLRDTGSFGIIFVQAMCDRAQPHRARSSSIAGGLSMTNDPPLGRCGKMAVFRRVGTGSASAGSG
jgi:hypothetical protein